MATRLLRSSLKTRYLSKVLRNNNIRREILFSFYLGKYNYYNVQLPRYINIINCQIIVKVPIYKVRWKILFSVLALVSTVQDKEKWQGERELVHKITLAEMALKDGDWSKAEQILESALKTADENNVLVGVSVVYDMLATIAYQQGNVERAEEILIQSIERLIQLGVPETDNQIVNFSLKLSRIYTILGEDELAEMGYKNCLAVQKRKIANGVNDDETGMLWISILFWYGKFLLNKERYQDAKVCLEKAYSSSAQVKGIMNTQIMVILYNLSEAAFSLKDYDSAQKHLLNAVILGKGTNNPDMPFYYTRIGIVYLLKGIYGEARMWCERAHKAALTYRNKEAELESQECLDQVKKGTKP